MAELRAACPCAGCRGYRERGRARLAATGAQRSDDLDHRRRARPAHGGCRSRGATVTTPGSTRGPCSAGGGTPVRRRPLVDRLGPGRRRDGRRPVAESVDSVACTGVSMPQPPVMTHCYRHPDREAGRNCTRCGRPACSDCLVQAAVGSHCLECAKAAKPDVKTRAHAVERPPDHPGDVRADRGQRAGLRHRRARRADARSGSAAGSASCRPTSASTSCCSRAGVGFGNELYRPHQWYRLVTSGFLHFGIIHIAFNMLLLFQLGQLLERSLGRLRFGLLYAAGAARRLARCPRHRRHADGDRRRGVRCGVRPDGRSGRSACTVRASTSSPPASARRCCSTSC